MFEQKKFAILGKREHQCFKYHLEEVLYTVMNRCDWACSRRFYICVDYASFVNNFTLFTETNCLSCFPSRSMYSSNRGATREKIQPN